MDFEVTFSESVTGVDTTDFSLTTTGVSGVSVTGVSGSGTTYTVTVGTGTGNGTIRLNVLDDDTIMDTLAHPLNGAFTSVHIGQDWETQSWPIFVFALGKTILSMIALP